MRKLLLVLCASLLAGCVSTQETYTQTGHKGHVISCTPGWTGGLVGAVAAASTNWGTCYQKAGEICGAGGFDVLQKSDEAGFYAQTGGYANRQVATAGGFASTTNNRMMIIQCKNPAIEAELAKKRAKQ